MISDGAHHHKARLRDYFDGVGFQRWSAIYGGEKLSLVRRTIRDGHGAMIALAERWLAEALAAGALPAGGRLLDAGCGTGLLSVAMARRGLSVTAVDIAPRMVAATRGLAREAGVEGGIEFVVDDLEGVGGSFDAAACLDVLIHYPRPAFGRLARRLAQRSRGPLLLTYAPREPLLAALHWLGGRFPKGQRRTDIQLIPEAEVEQTLAAAGMQIRRRARVSRGFYHVTLVEARPVGG
jgi:magnesium-protoporphyrin O-methyltransferase